MANNKLGDLGEEYAAQFLRRNGYRILTRKYRCRYGEIDIIAREKSIIVFVEVRSKSDAKYGLPYETINYAKRRHIEKVAVEFQKRYRLLDYDCRFDCVSVLFGDNHKLKDIELIKDAFWS